MKVTTASSTPGPTERPLPEGIVCTLLLLGLLLAARLLSWDLPLPQLGGLLPAARCAGAAQVSDSSGSQPLGPAR